MKAMLQLVCLNLSRLHDNLELPKEKLTNTFQAKNSQLFLIGQDCKPLFPSWLHSSDVASASL